MNSPNVFAAFSREILSSLALDVGGSFIKAAVIDRGSIGPNVYRVPVPGFRSEGLDQGLREIEPKELDAAIFSVLDGVRVSAADQVWITGQMAGLAFVDDDGIATAPLISWQDTRSDRLEEVTALMGPDVVADLGDGLRIGSPSVTLAAMDIDRRFRVRSLISYVAGRIAGQLAATIHTTDAAAWGLFDMRRMDWSPRACSVVGVDLNQLPNITTDARVTVGTSRVHVGVGDQQAALFGAHLEPGELSVNLATGCQVTILADFLSTGVQTRPYLESGLLHTVTHLPAGRLMRNAVMTVFGDDSPQSWTLAAAAADSDRRVHAAIEQIVDGIVGAAIRLQALGWPVVFSGGLVQQFRPLRDAIVGALSPSRVRTFNGDDAALAGLARLASENPSGGADG